MQKRVDRNATTAGRREVQELNGTMARMYETEETSQAPKVNVRIISSVSALMWLTSPRLAWNLRSVPLEKGGGHGRFRGRVEDCIYIVGRTAKPDIRWHKAGHQ